MKTSRKYSHRISSHPLVLVGLVTGLLALAACQPIRDPAAVAAEQTAIASGTVLPAEEATPEASEINGVEPAMATISTPSLRVRALPSDEADVVAAVNEGDTFTVTGISSDGAWIQISIEESESPDGLGWVSAEFVTLAGDITNIEIVDSATTEATVEATEVVTEEVTVEATDEATPEVTEEADEEATPEATEEPTVEATTVVTDEATVEATEVVTDEATVEATAVVTEEATPEPTEEATPEANEEATPEATEEATTDDLGTVTIIVDLPLRVRSEPTAEVENKIGSVYNLEVYTVLEVSEDGLWVRIETPQFPEGSGWVAAEFVVYNEAE